MKRLLLVPALALALLASAFLPIGGSPAEAGCYGSSYVSGYYRSNGTYVSGHYRSCPDSSFSNNWSSRGNVNPYTGSLGYRDYPSYSSYSSRSSYSYDYPSYSSYNYSSPSYSYGYGSGYSRSYNYGYGW